MAIYMNCPRAIEHRHQMDLIDPLWRAGGRPQADRRIVNRAQAARAAAVRLDVSIARKR
jgi:hypothetical protein